ncbi:MAG TPA: hypothetical protein VMZ91_09985, partial [Candidatus Paceibacterota bacterium]|nr:hypothetical protein [Candidatus Paceibacterota bacterium]
ASKVKITSSDVVGKVLVTFPNGQKVNINSSGIVIVGSNLAGKKYTFENGKIIAVDEKTTYARDEYEPVFTVEKVPETKRTINQLYINKELKWLNNRIGILATTSERTRQKNLLNELELLGLTLGTTIISGAVAIITLPITALNLIQNPSQILEIPTAISSGAKNFGQMIRTSPTQALGVIAGEVVLLYGTGATFKIIGKTSSKVKSLVRPAFNKVDRIRIVVKGQTVKFTKKVPVIKGIMKRAAVVKKIQVKEIARFRNTVEYSNLLNKARKIRKLARAKGRTVSVGNRDFIDAVASVENFADDFAKIKAKEFLNKLKKSGKKLGLGQEEQFIEAIRKYVKNQLNNYPRFKNLKEYSKFTEPYQFRLLKTKKISYANKLVKDITVKIKNLKTIKQANNLLKKIRAKATRINKSPERLKKYLTKKKLQRVYRKEFMKTNRYRMEKARKIRKVTIEQLKRSSTINQYRKFLDDFFDEVARRQKLDISKLSYRQFKNKIKEKLVRAIKTGNKEELKKFTDSIKKIANDMNKPSSNPVVRVIKKGDKTRRVRTIKDFKPDTPSGQYVEVKSGQQVMLQEVKQVQKAKTIQRVVQRPKLYIIQSVQKQRISLRPLLSFVTYSAQKLMPMQRSRQKTKQTLLLKSKSAQKSRVSQKLTVAQKSKQAQRSKQSQRSKQAQKLAVAQRTAQDTLTKQRLRLKLKTVQKYRKKKIISFKLPEKFTSKSLSKSQPTYYVVEKIRGKFKKLYPKPLTGKDAKDYAVYSIDNHLSKTAFFIPMGKARRVVSPPKQIQNYYSKNSHKVRPYKIKYGKRRQLVNGFI